MSDAALSSEEIDQLLDKADMFQNSNRIKPSDRIDRGGRSLKAFVELRLVENNNPDRVCQGCIFDKDSQNCSAHEHPLFFQCRDNLVWKFASGKAVCT